MVSFTGMSKKARIWSVCLAVGRQALGDADARAVELSRDPLVNGARSARLARIGVDEVNSPPKWQRLILKLTVLHYVRGVVVRKVVTELGESRSGRWIEGIPEVSATDGRDIIGLGFLVDNASASVVQHICAPQLLHQGPT